MKYNIYQVQKEILIKTLHKFIVNKSNDYDKFNIIVNDDNLENIDNALWIFSDEFFCHAKHNDDEIFSKNTNKIIYSYNDFDYLENENNINIFLINNGMDIDLVKKNLNQSLKSKRDTIVFSLISYNQIISITQKYSDYLCVYKMGKDLKWIEIFKQSESLL